MKNFSLLAMLRVSPILLVALLSWSANAETIIPLPNSVSPDRLDKDIPSPVPAKPMKMAPKLAPPAPPQPTLPAAAAQIKFTLAKVHIDGAHIYPPNELMKHAAPYIGKSISLVELYRIAEAMTNQYRNEGYVLSRALIPAQRIKNGEVTIRVIEGFIEKTRVSGQPAGAKPLIETYLKPVTDLKPLRVQPLEHSLLLINDIPGIDLNTVISPSKATPGAADLDVMIRSSRYQAYVSYDNRGTLYLGPQQVTVGGSVYSVFRPGDQTNFRMVTTGETDELSFFDVSHDEILNSKGTVLSVGGTAIRTNPGGLLKRYQLQGQSVAVSVKVMQPLIRARHKNASVTLGVDSLDSNSNLNTFNLPLYQDRIRSLRLGVSYDIADSLYGLNQFKGTVSQGISVFGASKAGNANLSRPRGKPEYAKLNVEASRTQALPRNFVAAAGVNGQYAFNPLLASEQFGYGGSQYGRGYDPSEILGDRGVAAKVELRYNSVVNQKYLQRVQYYAFYDAGAVWNIDTFSQPDKLSGTSTGLGVRLGFNKYLFGNLEVAKPLTRPVSILQQSRKNGSAPRIFFTLTWFDDGFKA